MSSDTVRVHVVNTTAKRAEWVLRAHKICHQPPPPWARQPSVILVARGDLSHVLDVLSYHGIDAEVRKGWTWSD